MNEMVFILHDYVQLSINLLVSGSIPSSATFFVMFAKKLLFVMAYTLNNGIDAFFTNPPP